MTVVVFGIDALDPDLVDPDEHPHLTLDAHHAIETLVSSSGDPSTHELWPTIISGLPPAEHGLVLSDGVAWENPLIAAASSVADYILPDWLQTQLGGWLLTNTDADAFRTPATYYGENGIETVFDNRESTAIGVPNYVVDPDTEDREHQLRRNMGALFERDPDATGGHRSADPVAFYEQCMEMAMIRIARIRRAVRSREHELVFGYTSGLDLIGHVCHNNPELQQRAYDELDEFVGELRTDLTEEDVLILVSDHGLQEGLHTDRAMIASSDPAVIEDVESVVDVYDAIQTELNSHTHTPTQSTERTAVSGSTAVQEQLEDLGYM
jgi:predicted AlkP superfamily pyrophosphatase or phosphodiesterase